MIFLISISFKEGSLSKKPEPRQKYIFLTGFGLIAVILYEFILLIKKIL